MKRIFPNFLTPAILLLATVMTSPAGAFSELNFLEATDDTQILELHQVEEAPEIDGGLAEEWWETARLGEPFGKPGNATLLKAATDGQTLFIGVRCYVDDPDALVREVQPGEGRSVWSDDCIDFKLSGDGGLHEYQFLVNPNGAVQAIRRGPSEDDWSPDLEVAAQVESDSYVVEMAIPLTDLGLEKDVTTANLALVFGRADRTGPVARLSTAFGAGYGNLEDAVQLQIGEVEYAESPLTREVGYFTVMTDRETYPSFEAQGIGRVILQTLPGGEALSDSPSILLSIHGEAEEAVLEQTISWEEDAERLDFAFDMEEFGPGEYRMEVRYLDGDDEVATQSIPLRVREAEAQTSGSLSINIPAAPASMEQWPVTFGVPFPQGALTDPEQVRVLDADGNFLPIQTSVAERWSRSGSIRWLHLHLLPSLDLGGTEVTLEYGSGVEQPAVTDLVTVDADEERIVVGNEQLRLTFSRQTPVGLERIERKMGDRFRTVSEADDISGSYMIDDQEVLYLGSADGEAEVVVEEEGPLRTVIRLSGYHYSGEGEMLGRYLMRWQVWAGQPMALLDHTFIITHDASEARYTDIGYRLPFRSTDAFFGSPRIHKVEVDDGGASMFQHDDQRFTIFEGETFKDEGHRSEGWLATGVPGNRMTLAVRDFWQQFPKELEILPDAVQIRFWAGTDREPVRTPDRISQETVHPFWWVHEGPVLDFTVPDQSLEYFEVDTIPEDVEHARMANPVGVSKTHQLLVYFHEDDWEGARSYSHNQVFQFDPTGVPDPQWIADSQVLGPISVQDWEAHPLIENALHASFDVVQRTQEEDRDYGLFNFGDSHHNWQWAERRWSLHRIWYNTHHGWNRWPWLLYARSGDIQYLQWALRNSRRAADLAYANYAPERFRNIGYPREKVPGGIHDYKGLVHWSAGGRLGYNSSADALLWHYLMTGERRGLDTAMNHGASLLADGSPRQDRSGSARIVSALALYWLTWDNDYLEFIERHMDRMLQNQAPEGYFSIGKENFAPFLQRYLELTDSDRAKQAVARWADFLAANPMGRQWSWLFHADVLATAYLHHGNREYLEKAAYKIGGFEELYEGEDPRFRGVFLLAPPGPLYRSYFMQQAPYYLTALNQHDGEAIEPSLPAWTEIRSLQREEIDGEERFVFRAYLDTGEDRPFTLHPVITRGAVPQETQQVRIRSLPDGEWIRAEGPLEERTPDGGRWTAQGSRSPGSGDSEFKLELEADGQTRYEIVFIGDSDLTVKVPVATEDTSIGEVYRISDRFLFPDRRPFHFVFVEGSESIQFIYSSRPRLARFEVRDPEGRSVFTDVWVQANTDRPREAVIRRGDRSREGWTFQLVGHHDATMEAAIYDPEEETPLFYFSTDAERWFQP